MDIMLCQINRDYRSYQLVTFVKNPPSMKMAEKISELKNRVAFWQNELVTDFGLEPVPFSVHFFVGKYHSKDVHGVCQPQGRGKVERICYLFNLGSLYVETDFLLNQTAPHEVCHGIEYMIYPEKLREVYDGHGDGWKSLMEYLGLPPQIKAGLPMQVLEEIYSCYAIEEN